MNTNNKTLYNSISIPKELDQMINSKIEDVRNEKNSRQKKLKQQWIVAAVLVFGLFVVPLNVSQSFAENINKIPILKDVAQLLTFRTYDFETESATGEVNVPGVTGIANKDYQKQLNLVIDKKVEEALRLSKERAQEYKDAYIETGGTEEDYANRKIEIAVDYKVFSNQNKQLSFLVFSHESLAAVYATYEYYNIDLENSNIIVLEDLLGDAYQALITKRVKETALIQKEKGEVAFFDDIFDSEWTARKDMDFYINESGHVVVVFDKYEIAAGVYGRLEYEID